MGVAGQGGVLNPHAERHADQHAVHVVRAVVAGVITEDFVRACIASQMTAMNRRVQPQASCVKAAGQVGSWEASGKGGKSAPPHKAIPSGSPTDLLPCKLTLIERYQPQNWML